MVLSRKKTEFIKMQFLHCRKVALMQLKRYLQEKSLEKNQGLCKTVHWKDIKNEIRMKQKWLWYISGVRSSQLIHLLLAYQIGIWKMSEKKTRKNQENNPWNNEKNQPQNKLNSLIALVSVFKSVLNQVNILDKCFRQCNPHPPRPPLSSRASGSEGSAY